MQPTLPGIAISIQFDVLAPVLLEARRLSPEASERRDSAILIPGGLERQRQSAHGGTCRWSAAWVFLGKCNCLVVAPKESNGGIHVPHFVVW